MNLRTMTYENFLDVGRVGEEHDEAVKTETPTTGGGKTVLEAVLSDHCWRHNGSTYALRKVSSVP